MRKLIVVNIIVGILVSCDSSNEKKKKSLNGHKPSEIKKEVITVKKYEDKEGRFEINFPNDKVETQVIESQQGINVNVFLCQFEVNENDNIAYIAGYYDLRDTSNYSLDVEAKYTAEGSSTRIIENKVISYRGTKGKETKSINKEVLIKSRFFKVGKRVYKLQVGTLPSKGENKAMYDFLNSFKIIE